MKIVKLIHRNSRSEVFKMNRMYLINYNIQTSVWGGQFKYSIILNTKKINLKDKLTDISTF